MKHKGKGRGKVLGMTVVEIQKCEEIQGKYRRNQQKTY